MTDAAEDLEGLWRALPAPAGPLMEAREAGAWAGGQLLAALDSDGRRHLLVAVPDQPRVSIPRLRGLDSQTRRMRAAGRTGAWLDLTLLDTQGLPAFTLLCADVIAAAAATRSVDPTFIATVIARWRRFWTGRQDELSREARLGLFGELWMLTHWLPELSAATVNSWQGPLGGRHDFANPTVSVEVKTTATTGGPVVHRVASLDQLAPPEQGQLYLLSLRVTSDATGTHSLERLVDQARDDAAAAGPGVADDLDDRLAAVGWTPMHRGRYDEPLRVAGQILYRVDGTFPRLTMETLPDLPDGIVDVRYSLDTSVCGPWQTATEPEHPGPLDALLQA